MIKLVFPSLFIFNGFHLLTYDKIIESSFSFFYFFSRSPVNLSLRPNDIVMESWAPAGFSACDRIKNFQAIFLKKSSVSCFDMEKFKISTWVDLKNHMIRIKIVLKHINNNKRTRKLNFQGI